ncbi:uncharacterized protein LOC106089769 [Stomoxys calcitrans]|uniref:uncharacterized protein LOC106089769 n=1 Tax=Stomoxys calcitrans TaxID=35570 RepID=UPI0027E29926|nr:uncharacterized protein LOC106089769 [Stomoxys calcitrans]
MLLKKAHACLLILFSFFSLIESIKRRYDLVLHNITCEKFNSAVKEFDCDLQMLNAGSYALDMSFMYSKDLPKTAEWHTLIYFTHAQVKAGKPVKFLDFKINICNFLTTAMGVPFVKVLVEEMRKTSNLPYKCPLKGLVTMQGDIEANTG